MSLISSFVRQNWKKLYILNREWHDVKSIYKSSTITFERRLSSSYKNNSTTSTSTSANSNNTDSNNNNINTNNNGALSGLRILDMTRVLAGPFCTMVLGDLGAEIIKVERPQVGDDTRNWGPPWVGDESAYFLSVNRNKRSICVDISTSEGSEIIRKLAAKSDVIVENYLPGKLSKYGLSYEDLKEKCPHLIYCSITGYGQEGPYKNRPGYDVIAAGMGGLMHITGPKDGGPCRVGVAMTDISTGLYAYGAILAAILQRQKNGKGQHIDCNLLSTQVSILSHIGANYLNCGQEGGRHGTGHGSIVPYQAFKTKDSYFIIGGGNNKQFEIVCDLLQLPNLPSDQRFSTNAERVKNREILVTELSEKFALKSTQDWMTIFNGAEVPYGPINSIQEVFEDDQVIHNNMIQTMEHKTAGTIRVPGPAVHYSDNPPVLSHPPPTLGQHTNTILRETLNLSEQQIQLLHEKKAVE